MKLKKLFAGVLTGAMVLSTMIINADAAIQYEMQLSDYVDIDAVTVTMTVTNPADAWFSVGGCIGWSEGTDGWDQVQWDNGSATIISQTDTSLTMSYTVDLSDKDLNYSSGILQVQDWWSNCETFSIDSVDIVGTKAAVETTTTTYLQEISLEEAKALDSYTVTITNPENGKSITTDAITEYYTSYKGEEPAAGNVFIGVEVTNVPVDKANTLVFTINK